LSLLVNMTIKFRQFQKKIHTCLTSCQTTSHAPIGDLIVAFCNHFILRKITKGQRRMLHRIFLLIQKLSWVLFTAKCNTRIKARVGKIQPELLKPLKLVLNFNAVKAYTILWFIAKQAIWVRSYLHLSLKRMFFSSIPTVTNIVNLSLSSGQFHPILKQSIISPILKKFTFDKDFLSNYRPISSHSVVSKIIERIVKSRLTNHLSSNNFLNLHQSAYCKHHSTEIALSYIHDHLINAIGSQKISCLCLLDLSAAFDTKDHNILITRLSYWIGIHGSVLNWFKCYLSSRSFRVKSNASLRRIPVCVFCSWPPTFYYIHPSSRYPYFFPIIKPPSLCRWYTIYFLFLCTWFSF